MATTGKASSARTKWLGSGMLATCLLRAWTMLGLTAERDSMREQGVMVSVCAAVPAGPRSLYCAAGCMSAGLQRFAALWQRTQDSHAPWTGAGHEAGRGEGSSCHA
jgi:hypothetical protein